MLTKRQKSREKNVSLEETRRRNEASMRRKNALPSASVGGSTSAGDGGQQSPGSTGAMDSLLEKLRAAAPQARDQRDRRRRARLQNRHQVRVASGQAVPDHSEGGLESDSTGLPSPEKGRPSDGGVSAGEPTSESEDVADRAASMLEGLRGDGVEEGEVKVRRRRESVEDERRARRRRRGTSNNPGGANGIASEEGREKGVRDGDVIPEEDGELDDEQVKAPPVGDNPIVEAQTLPQITTIISPPSPAGESE